MKLDCFRVLVGRSSLIWCTRMDEPIFIVATKLYTSKLFTLRSEKNVVTVSVMYVVLIFHNTNWLPCITNVLGIRFTSCMVKFKKILPYIYWWLKKVFESYQIMSILSTKCLVIWNHTEVIITKYVNTCCYDYGMTSIFPPRVKLFTFNINPNIFSWDVLCMYVCS